MTQYYSYDAKYDILFRVKENGSKISFTAVKCKIIHDFVLLRCYFKYLLHKNFNNYLIFTNYEE